MDQRHLMCEHCKLHRLVQSMPAWVCVECCKGALHRPCVSKSSVRLLNTIATLVQAPQNLICELGHLNNAQSVFNHLNIECIAQERQSFRVTTFSTSEIATCPSLHSKQWRSFANCITEKFVRL